MQLHNLDPASLLLRTARHANNFSAEASFLQSALGIASLFHVLFSDEPFFMLHNRLSLRFQFLPLHQKDHTLGA